jgi:hypothetical protein
MKRVRQFFTGVLALVLGLGFLVSAALFMTVMKPGWILREGVLRKVAALLEPSVKLEWQSLRALSRSDGWFKRRLVLEGSGVCVVASEGIVRTCFASAQLGVGLDFGRVLPRVAIIGPIALKGGQVQVLPKKSAKAVEVAEQSSSPFSLPSIVTDADLDTIEIDVERWVLVEPGFHGLLRIAGVPDGESYSLDLGAQAQGRQKEEAELRLRLRNDQGPWSFWTWSTQLGARAKLPRGIEASLDGEFQPVTTGREASPVYRTDLRASYRQRRKRDDAKARVSGTVSSRESTLKLEATYKRERFGQVELADCGLSAADRGGARADVPSRFGLSCVARLEVLLPPEKIPESLRQIVASNRWALQFGAILSTRSYPPSPSELLAGEFSVKLQDVRSRLIDLSGGVSARIDAVPTELPERGQLETTLDFRAAIPRLQEWVKDFEKTRWAIPSPFHVLDGRVELAASGVSTLSEGGSIPVTFRTDLASQTQRLNVNAGGELQLMELRKVNPRLELRGLVELADIRLNLPRMNASLPPRLFPDGRIRKASEAEGPQGELSGERAATVNYDFEIRTEPHPIRLASNLAQAPIPIHLDLRLSDSGGVAGQVAVQEFPIELFRREARVKHLRLDLADSVNQSRIDGRIDVDYTDIDIHMLMLGSIEKPSLRFTSDPPLPEDQVISALLFGRRIEELDPEENSSVGDTRAALADNALGLASMYALASTPIESLGYNPTTGVVSARVRLGDGLSLSLGGRGGEGVNQVGVRRRLGSKWTLSTDVEPSTIQQGSGANSGASTATATVEWRMRY